MSEPGRLGNAEGVGMAAIEQAVSSRLSGTRLAHSLAVAKTAENLALQYGVSQQDARVAGLLHDWDKGLTSDELVQRAIAWGIPIPENPEKLLHAHTGACAVAELYPEIGAKVAQAIDRHTLAAVDMSDLDMIIYIADLIEPTRDYADPRFVSQVDTLRDRAGKDPLMLVFMLALQLTLDYLTQTDAFVHPLSLAAMNDILNRCDDTEHPVYQLALVTLDMAEQIRQKGAENPTACQNQEDK